MTTSHYDVIVVGAGPAGAAAAYHAASGGARVAIIDKAVFPRAKTCGDSLSPRALAAIDRMGVTDLGGYPISAIHAIHVPSGRRQEIDIGIPAAAYRGMTVARRVLDHRLLEQAKAAGAEHWLGRVTELVRGRSGRAGGIEVVTTAGRSQLSAGHIVMATGASAWTRSLSLSVPTASRDVAVAARTYVRLRQHAGQAAEMYLPPTPRLRRPMGYSWVFPVSASTVNVGAGYVIDRSATGLNPKRVLSEFLHWLVDADSRFADFEACERPAVATVPLGPARFGERGLLLVGDAAGLANPLTAEGIAMALESGELAGRALTEKDDGVYDAYRASVERRQERTLGVKRRVSDVYAGPDLLIGRGADVLVEPHRGVGLAVCRVILSLAELEASPIVGLSDSVTAEATEIRARVGRLASRTSPLLGDVVRELWAIPGAGSSQPTALAAAVWSGDNASAPPIPEPRRTILTIMEALALVATIQRDLVVSGTAPRWGRNTHGLLVIDALNAGILRLMTAIPSRWMRQLSALGRSMFREGARNAAGASDELAAAYARFYTLAALAGARADVARVTDSGLLAVVNALAALDVAPLHARTDRLVALARQATARMPGARGTNLRSLIEALANSRCAAGPRERPVVASDDSVRRNVSMASSQD